MQLIPHQDSPRYIRLHPSDNVGVVVNDQGVAAGGQFDDGLTAVEGIPQSHKVALVDIAEGHEVVRYGEVIGYALKPIAAGSWVTEQVLRMPEPPLLGNLPKATLKTAPGEPLEGYTFEGFRNPDGSVGTRNILGVTTTVQCVVGVLDHVVERVRKEVLPKYPNVDDVVALSHSYGCGVAINAPDAVVPIRTLYNISRNPNLGGQALVISLGCEKLQANQLMDGDALTNGMDIMNAMVGTETSYVTGLAGFIRGNLLIFMGGAIMGEFMDKSGAAKAIAQAVMNKVGNKSPYLVLLGIAAVGAILTYAGISMFVAMFALIPLARPLFRECINFSFEISPFK